MRGTVVGAWAFYECGSRNNHLRIELGKALLPDHHDSRQRADQQKAEYSEQREENVQHLFRSLGLLLHHLANDVDNEADNLDSGKKEKD